MKVEIYTTKGALVIKDAETVQVSTEEVKVFYTVSNEAHMATRPTETVALIVVDGDRMYPYSECVNSFIKYILP